MHIRAAAVAGLFYPDRPDILRSEVKHLMSGPSIELPNLRALILPHAGYRYSGTAAGAGYAALAAHGSLFNKVLLIGPAHRLQFHGLAACSFDAFNTPLGDVPVDQELTEALCQLPQVQRLDQAHVPEHSLEVQLPFLTCALKRFSIIPILTGSSTPEEINEVLLAAANCSDTLILISSDLSHYLTYSEAQAMDCATTSAIERLAADSIKPHNACGAQAIKGLLLYAATMKLKAHVICVNSSGDTAGDRERVVGYGSYGFTYTN